MMPTEIPHFLHEPVPIDQQIIDAIPALIGYIDQSLHLRFLNNAFAIWFAQPIEALRNKSIADILGPDDFACARPFMERALAGMPQNYERTLLSDNKQPRHVIASYIPHKDGNGNVLGFVALVSDVTELVESRKELARHQIQLADVVRQQTQELKTANEQLIEQISIRERAEQVSDAECRTMEMICKGTVLGDILYSICETFEKFSDGGLCSVLIADEDKAILQREISLNLPAEFAQAVREIPIAAKAGTSGTAAFLKSNVFAENIATDSGWFQYRAVALKNNILSCWSAPILSGDGKVFGTLTLYYHVPQHPPKSDRMLVERATHLASIAFERDESQKRLQYLSSHDPLTHLPNRTFFHSSLHKAIAKAQRSGSMIAVMFIDLDKFKHVNDALGHTMGDELLRQVSSRLVGSVRLGDIIGRLGGDEFAALIEDVSSPGEAEQIASKLIHVLSRRFNLGKKAVSISCSIGISFYPLHGHESQSLLMKADLAMYAAKNDGRNNFKTYAPYMDDANPSVSPALDLHEALARNQLVLYYQPLFDSDKGRVTSMEALIRWNHPTMGLLLPFQFIPEAEKSDYIIAIGKWALKKACEQIKVCHNAGFKVRVAVNVSSKQLRQPSFATYVCDLLDKNQLTPNFLQLELNESVVSQYDARSLNNLMELKRYGVHIMVDDFGTSYSSLSYLRSLPIDGLKIDKSFTQDAPTDKAAASIIDALLALAKGLKLEVTAQGVERADQVAFLAGHGCTQIQGYAVSEPLPAEELMQFLTSHPM